jgi:hypothetical protein
MTDADLSVFRHRTYPQPYVLIPFNRFQGKEKWDLTWRGTAGIAINGKSSKRTFHNTLQDFLKPAHNAREVEDQGLKETEDYS